MDDNLDEYQTVASLREFHWVHPCRVRKIMANLSCKYTIEIQTLQPQLYLKARKVVEDDHCRFDIICANLSIADKPYAKSYLATLMEKRMHDGYSVVAVEVETRKVLGVLIAVERDTLKNLQPDNLEDLEMDTDIQYIEQLRCFLINRAKNTFKKYIPQRERCLEIVLLCGSRETANHFKIEVTLVDALLRIAISKQIQFIITISDYRKHQQHYMSLGFTKVSEMAYGTINSQYEVKKFPKTDASTSVMCLFLKLIDKSRKRQRALFKIRWATPVRRVTRLQLALH